MPELKTFAVEVAPGRYAWHTKRFPYTSGAWLTANSDWLLEASYDGVEIHERFATLMPPWWSPSQRFAWRNVPNMDCRGNCNAEKRYLENPHDDFGVPAEFYERITADLETGAEIPA